MYSIINVQDWIPCCTDRPMMESICHLTATYIFRLCSAVIDVVSIGSSTKQAIRVYIDRDPCTMEPIKGRGEFAWTNALCCRVVHQEMKLKTTLFHLLADCRERGAVFVLHLRALSQGIELLARITKIGALLNPYGSKEVELCSHDAPSVWEEETPWNSEGIQWLKRKQYSKKNENEKNGTAKSKKSKKRKKVISK